MGSENFFLLQELHFVQGSCDVLADWQILNRVQQFTPSELKYSIPPLLLDNEEDQILKSSDDLLHLQHKEQYFLELV